jgi:PAS domain S-box-containing protein
MANSPTVPILLVDDRHANLEALGALLASPEHELILASSGQEALALLERRDFAVILLDVQMPTMDGIETALKMRELAVRLGRYAPIIFVTAIDTDRARILRAYATGGVDFVQKPLDPEIISAKVSVFVELYRAKELSRERGEKLAALLEETERYRLLVASVKDYAIFVLDPGGHVATWNPGAERIKGYAAGEIVGKHFSTFYPPDDIVAGKPDRELEVAARDGVFRDEGWRLRKDGTRFWASLVITAMRSDSGQLVGFAKVTRDLTERVRNEEQLRRLAAENAALGARAEAEKELRVRREFLARSGEALASSLDYRTTLATVARLAVPELADWCTVQLIEPGAAAPVQVAVAHVDPSKAQLAREMVERYPPNLSAPMGAPRVIRSGKPEIYAELPAALLEARAQDAEHLRFIRELQLESAMIVPLSGRDRVLGAISFIYANSGRRYTESDLAFAEDFARRAALAIENAQAHAALSAVLEFQERFVAILGHDLRNPLAATEMGIALLKRRWGSAAPRIFERLESSSRRMSRMIEQVLDLTRTRLAHGLEMKPQPVDLCATLRRVVEELRVGHPSRAIELRCDPGLGGTWDPDRLEQVFSNLIGNAIQHGQPDEPVTVDASETKGTVHVRVHNHGRPIPAKLQDELFNPFRRGPRDSRATQTAGLGLGLYISREIVVGHGGEIEVESGPEMGTTFRVTLPRRTVLPEAR